MPWAPLASDSSHPTWEHEGIWMQYYPMLHPSSHKWDGDSKGPVFERLMKRTRFPKGEPDSLYRRDSPWISSYHIKNSFQLHITVILLDRNHYMDLIIHSPVDLRYDNQSTSPSG